MTHVWETGKKNDQSNQQKEGLRRKYMGEFYNRLKALVIVTANITKNITQMFISTQP